MNEPCGYCGHPADVTINVTLDNDTMTLTSCRTCMLDTLATIAATIDLCHPHPFDKTIARLERKMRDGTGSDNELTELARYRRLRQDAITRHPSSPR